MAQYAEAAETTVYTFERSTALRWRGGVLEQAWVCKNTGSIKWEPIPHVSTAINEMDIS